MCFLWKGIFKCVSVEQRKKECVDGEIKGRAGFSSQGATDSVLIYLESVEAQTGSRADSCHLSVSFVSFPF